MRDAGSPGSNSSARDPRRTDAAGRLRYRELNGLIADLRDARPGAEAGRLEHEARAYLRALAATGTVTEGESAALTAAIEEARTAQAHTPERTTFEHLHPELKRHRETAQIYTLGLALAADCPDNDCRVYLNIFNGARELDAALDNLDAEGAPALALRKALRERVGELAEMFDGNFAVKQYRKEARS